MKALTLYQPWATLIAIRAKKIETRSWSTKYRGPLAVHASGNVTFIHMKSRDYICDKEPFQSILTKELNRTKEINFMPMGAIIAVCNLEACFKIDPGPLLISEMEKAFGDYTPGRFMWMLEDMQKLDEPIYLKGRMGLWEWKAP